MASKLGKMERFLKEITKTGSKWDMESFIGLMGRVLKDILIIITFMAKEFIAEMTEGSMKANEKIIK